MSYCCNRKLRTRVRSKGRCIFCALPFALCSLLFAVIKNLVADSQRRPAVAGRRLHKDPPKRGVRKNLSVHDGVVSNSTGQAKISQSRGTVQMIQHVKRDLLKPQLETGGYVRLAI